MVGDRPRVLVFGTGALGCLFGARLARSGLDVTIVGTWAEALEAITRGGVAVSDQDGEWSAPVRTARLGAALEPAPLAFVFVKSHQTAAVAPALARALAPDGLAVTLQNGLGNAEALAASLGADRVLTGVTVVGAFLAGPGRVRATPGRVVLGTRPGCDQAVTTLAGWLRAAGFGVEVTPAIEAPIWRKLAANCAINALSALRGVRNGALLDEPGAGAVVEAAAREVGAVAAARGVHLGADPLELTMEVLRQTAANRSSMLQDVQQRRRTEIDALNGAVVREGQRLGVPTPINEELWRKVRALEDTFGREPVP
jgi:2-dehydropantoate 2-reductase